MDFLEPLVELASFGTAGVSVLAIFYIGYCIKGLSNDAPAWKPSLMRKYMSMCITIAIICAISGGANAYFNQGKIEKAEKQTDQLAAAYDKERDKVESDKQAVEASLDSLKMSLRQNQMLTPAVTSALSRTAANLRSIQLQPRQDLMRNVVTNPANR